MPTRRHPLYDRARRARDSNGTLGVAFVVAAVASIPSAGVLGNKFQAALSTELLVASWAVAAALLAGHLLVQFLAAVPTADDYVAENPDDYRWTFAYLRAVAVRPFATLATSVWLVVLAVLAPLVGVPTAPAVFAGAVACAAFCVVVAQPHASPTLGE